MHRFTRIAGAVSLALALPLTAAVMAARPFDDPIGGAAHGAVFGADGKQVKSPPSSSLAPSPSTSSARSDGCEASWSAPRYESKRSYLEDMTRGTGKPGGPAERRSSRAASCWTGLIHEVAPADAVHLQQRNNVLVSLLRRGLGHPEGTPYRMQPHGGSAVPPGRRAFAAGGGGDAAVGRGAAGGARLTRRSAVRRACLPRPRGARRAPAAGTSKGVLADPFISTGLSAEVFVHQSAAPQGVCLALPRYGAGAGAQIELLGIICMETGIDIGGGKFASNACFWDNQKDDKVRLVSAHRRVSDQHQLRCR
jgi:hypothetical protein